MGDLYYNNLNLIIHVCFLLSPHYSLIPMHFRWFARHFVSLIFQSWFKNRRFKWRKEAREGSHTSPAALPAPAQGISLMYQPRYVYSSGQFPVSAQCQGCFTRQPSSDSHSHVDFTPYPYSSHWPTVKYLCIFALYICIFINFLFAQDTPEDEPERRGRGGGLDRRK